MFSHIAHKKAGLFCPFHELIGYVFEDGTSDCTPYHNTHKNSLLPCEPLQYVESDFVVWGNLSHILGNKTYNQNLLD